MAWFFPGILAKSFPNPYLIPLISYGFVSSIESGCDLVQIGVIRLCDNSVNGRDFARA